ncbi:hypothetical protein BST40_27780 [Mycobacterium persicum]|nr:hypothetical protein A4G31_02355 [Mycobacterium persicum]ORB32697.1 hypothetical protein BST40_27780 [Mycobacterium persicum]ORB91157.1 hypothetical protein B1T49_20135 [Mycobacterium persicum]
MGDSLGGVFDAAGQLLQDRVFASASAVPHDCACPGQMKSGSLRGRGQVAGDRCSGQCQCLLIFAGGEVGVQESHVGHGLIVMLL